MILDGQFNHEDDSFEDLFQGKEIIESLEAKIKSQQQQIDSAAILLNLLNEEKENNLKTLFRLSKKITGLQDELQLFGDIYNENRKLKLSLQQERDKNNDLQTALKQINSQFETLKKDHSEAKRQNLQFIQSQTQIKAKNQLLEEQISKIRSQNQKYSQNIKRLQILYKEQITKNSQLTGRFQEQLNEILQDKDSQLMKLKLQIDDSKNEFEEFHQNFLEQRKEILFKINSVIDLLKKSASTLTNNDKVANQILDSSSQMILDEQRQAQVQIQDSIRKSPKIIYDKIDILKEHIQKSFSNVVNKLNLTDGLKEQNMEQDKKTIQYNEVLGNTQYQNEKLGKELEQKQDSESTNKSPQINKQMTQEPKTQQNEDIILQQKQKFGQHVSKPAQKHNGQKQKQEKSNQSKLLQQNEISTLKKTIQKQQNDISKARQTIIRLYSLLTASQQQLKKLKSKS